MLTKGSRTFKIDVEPEVERERLNFIDRSQGSGSWRKSLIHIVIIKTPTPRDRVRRLSKPPRSHNANHQPQPYQTCRRK